MNSEAAKTATGIVSATVPIPAITAPATTSVAAITAMPAPCGIGMRCEDRAFGVASACRSSTGRIAHVIRAESAAAASTAKSNSSGSERVMLRVAVTLEIYLGTSMGAVPCAAFSALKIHTSPPKAPTRKYTAPNSSETLTPSLVISPA